LILLAITGKLQTFTQGFFAADF